VLVSVTVTVRCVVEMRVEFDGITVTDWALLTSKCDDDDDGTAVGGSDDSDDPDDSDASGNPSDADVADGADVVDDGSREETATEDDAREERCEADTKAEDATEPEAEVDVELRPELVAVDAFTPGTVRVPRLPNDTAISAVGAGI